MVLASRAATVLIMNWSEGVDLAILLVRAVLSMLICRLGRRIWDKLSSEVSMEFFWERASMGPIWIPGMWFHSKS